MAEQKLKPGGVIGVSPGELPFSPLEAEAAAYLQAKVGAVFFPKRHFDIPPPQSYDLSFCNGSFDRASHCLRGLDFYIQKIPVGDQFCQPGYSCAYADKLRRDARAQIVDELKGRPLLSTVNDLYIYRNQFTKTSMSTVILFLESLADIAWGIADSQFDNVFSVVDPSQSAQSIPEVTPNHTVVHLAISLSRSTDRLTSLLTGGVDSDRKTFIEPYSKLSSYEDIDNDSQPPQKGRLAVVHEFEDTIVDLFRKLA